VRISSASEAVKTRLHRGSRSLRVSRFDVEDIEDVLTRLRAHGAELLGEVAQYENIYRLCYVRGLEGIIVALAEQLI
jgi:predicted enzyme related to lactoylglutathione lyase